MKEMKEILKGIAWGVVVCAIISMCSSCRTKYVDISEDMFIHDTTFIQKMRVDTFLQHDSIFHSEFIKGDTIQIKDYVYKYIYKPQIEYRDSIVYRDKENKIVQTKEVEKKLSWWQKTLMYLGGVSLLLIGLIIYNKVKR